MPDRDERGRLLPGHGVVSPGRPRTEAAERLRAELEQVIGNGTLPKWRAAMKRKLEKGDQWATEFAFERIAGKVVDKVEQTVTLKGYVTLSPDDWDDDTAGNL